jgi:hypothetical protein
MQIITRDKFTLLPMPPSVIEYLNDIAEKQKRKISKDPIFRFGYDINRYVNDNDADVQGKNDIEGVIDQLVDRTTVSMHDRGDIDIPAIDMDAYEPPVIVEKADELVSPIQFTQNPMFKPKIEGSDMIQDESSKIDDLPDTDEISDDNPVVKSPDCIKITTISRTPVEFTYEHMPRYKLRQRRGDWRHGPWQEQERVHEYELHITAMANKFGY